MTAPAGEPDAWVTTERVVLRPPRPDDLDDYVRLHTDPRTYAHALATMPTPERCRDRLAADLADWGASRLGYAAVVDRASAEVIGWAGLRHKDSDVASLNLYYRLAHDRLGSGLGREISRALVAWGVEHRPEAVVTAMVDPVNTASLRTARGCGLVQVGTRSSKDDPEGKPMAYFEAPRVRVVPAAEAESLREAVVDLWVRVNDDGGSVGFLPGAAATDVAAALDRHLDDVRAGRSLLCVLVDPVVETGATGADGRGGAGDSDDAHAAAGRLRGLGFWEHSRGFPYDHVAKLKRLMVDPSAQGRNLGRILLGAMVGVARRELPWVELLRLDYRDGLGLGDFYEKAGWTEVGRVPRGLRLGPTDYRDDVAMARRVDGGPLR
ncbi:GNAT family N-acetyltransferase [Terrabacter sp. 2RAF25]|uniref:GNAT family N-acetyltransferase n=1 Tax=Terrabacter sp. 2RAF25 TaxID=3232998 RepID=UPI003F9EAA37